MLVIIFYPSLNFRILTIPIDKIIQKNPPNSAMQFFDTFYHAEYCKKEKMAVIF